MEHPAEKKPYFVGFWVDFLCMGGGSILFYFILLFFYKEEWKTTLVPISAFLLWTVNWPHFSATLKYLYSNKQRRAEYRTATIVSPLALAAVSAWALASPQFVAPYLFMLFMVWSPYHSSGQSFGFSLLYAKRCGFTVGAKERLAFSVFMLSVFASSLTNDARINKAALFYGFETPGLGLPSWIGPTANTLTAAAAAALLLLYARASLRSQRLIPPIVLVPAAAHYFWFSEGIGFPPYFIFTSFFHSIQYLMPAWALHLNETVESSTETPSLTAVGLLSLRWLTLNIVGGIFLFWIVPRAVSRGFGTPVLLTAGVVAVGVKLHHFFVDGIIWKLRRSSVASPLMVNVPELLKPPPKDPEPSRP